MKAVMVKGVTDNSIGNIYKLPDAEATGRSDCNQ